MAAGENNMLAARAMPALAAANLACHMIGLSL
jgi:hypothetical protein